MILRVPHRRFLTVLILAGVVGLLLLWRWNIALVRFFDVDEFTHMHWAAQIAHGEKPYVDFFTFFTPGYYWFLRPLFTFWGSSPVIFIAGRISAFVIFLGILALLASLFARLRSRRFALLPVIFLAFLPMPYDKYLEIRPDNLATLLGMAAVYLIIHGLLTKNALVQKRCWFIAGITAVASIIVLTKMLPFFAVPVAIIGLSFLLRWREEKQNVWKTVPPEAVFFMGCISVLVLFGLWALSLGHFDTVWYSLMKLPFESNTINRFMIMESHLFFFPNSSFYGATGITIGLLANHAVWIAGLLFGVVRFFTPFTTAKGDRQKVLVELLLGGIFVVSVVGYVQFFPLKHSQYLIPIAIFIAFYAADALVCVLEKVEQWHWTIMTGILAFVCGFLLVANAQVNTVKLGWTNDQQLKEITQLTVLIPKNKEVFDLEGAMIFWHNPYYICCLTYGNFLQYLSRQPRPLSQVLEERLVPYVYQGRSGRLNTLSVSEQEYIRSHYAQVNGWGEMLWRRQEK